MEMHRAGGIAWLAERFPGMHKALGSISNTNRAWWGIAVIPALRRLWQEDREFKIILGYIKLEASLGYTRPYLQNPKPDQMGQQIEACVSDPEVFEEHLRLWQTTVSSHILVYSMSTP